jgi:hypothetical protein
MNVKAELVVVIERPARRLYLGRALSGMEEIYVAFQLEADCTYYVDADEFRVHQPRIVSHDGPEDLTMRWEDFDRIQLKQAMRALSDAYDADMLSDLPFVLPEVAEACS